MRTAFVATVLVGTLLSANAWAQSDDAVVVLSNGGVDSLEVFDLTAAQPRTSVRLGERRMLPRDIGLARVADVKILPDGSHLLADVDGRGAVVTTPNGAEVRWTLDPEQRLGGIDAATVGSYFAPGEPSLVVTGDSASSSVTVRNTSQNSTVWFDITRIATSRGVIPQVAVMPDNLVAIAVNWLDVGVYGIRVRSTSGPGGQRELEISSGTHVETPESAVIVPELDLIRDLMVLDDGRMLVTTRFTVLILAGDGTLDEVVDVAAEPAINGQLASVRVLPSGLWAIASFEPGEWVEPNVNHRVHWYEPETGEVVASTTALNRAPLRVEPLAGTGGTNTVGFDAGLDLIQQGDPTAVNLVALVVPPTTPVGTFISVRGIVQNGGDSPVGLASIAVRAAPGPCTTAGPADLDLAVATSVALNPGQQFSWLGDVFVDDSFVRGEWCAFVQGRDQTDVLRDYGERIEFQITDAVEGTGSTVDVKPLPFNTGPEADMGGDAGDLPDAGDAPPPDEGCCASTPAQAPRSLGLLIALALLIGRRRWVARREASS